MARYIRPPRGVFVVSGDGQGNLTITGVSGEGEYFGFDFQMDDYFHYAIENKTLHLAEVGLGQIVSLGSGLGVFSRTVIESTDGTNPINVPQGTPFSMIIKTPDATAISKDPISGQATNKDAIVKVVHVPDFETLRTQALPETNDSFFYVMTGTADGDGRGGLFEWRSASNATEQNVATDLTVNVIKSQQALNGRYHRIEIMGQFPELPSNSRPQYSVWRDPTTKGPGINLGTRGDKFIPAVENFYQGSYDHWGTVLALPSTKWRDGDWIEVWGWNVAYKYLEPIKAYWVANDTETDAAVLNRNKWRPTDISGGAAGRWVSPTPVNGLIIPNSDATPDMSLSDVFYGPEIAPAAITGFTFFKNGRRVKILPGAVNLIFAHSSTLKCPQGENYVLEPGGAPINLLKDNDVVWLEGPPRPLKWQEYAAGHNGSTLVFDRVLYDKTKATVLLGGAVRVPNSQITLSQSATQTTFTFSPTIDTLSEVYIQG